MVPRGHNIYYFQREQGDPIPEVLISVLLDFGSKMSTGNKEALTQQQRIGP